MSKFSLKESRKNTFPVAFKWNRSIIISEQCAQPIPLSLVNLTDAAKRSKTFGKKWNHSAHKMVHANWLQSWLVASFTAFSNHVPRLHVENNLINLGVKNTKRSLKSSSLISSSLLTIFSFLLTINDDVFFLVWFQVTVHPERRVCNIWRFYLIAILIRVYSSEYL